MVEKGERAFQRGNADSTYSKVIFQPGGGMRKRGCFIETGSTAEYEKPESLRFIVNCPDLIYRRSWGQSVDVSVDQTTWTDEVAERFFGKGALETSTEPQPKLSFLGSAREHGDLRVVIRRGDHKAIYLIPSKSVTGGDSSEDENFAIDIILDARSFDEFKDELRAHPSYRADISIRLDGISGIYVTGSVESAQAGVVKFLDRLDDVSNRDDIPDDLGAFVLGEPFPFSLTIGQPDL